MSDKQYDVFPYDELSPEARELFTELKKIMDSIKKIQEEIYNQLQKRTPSLKELTCSPDKLSSVYVFFDDDNGTRKSFLLIKCVPGLVNHTDLLVAADGLAFPAVREHDQRGIEKIHVKRISLPDKDNNRFPLTVKSVLNGDQDKITIECQMNPTDDSSGSYSLHPVYSNRPNQQDVDNANKKLWALQINDEGKRPSLPVLLGT